MPAPEVSAFGDGDHQAGDTGLTIDGGGFGAFPGEAWIYENSDRTGDSDELTIGSWNDIALSSVEVPGSLNNSAGTRYLFVQREDLAWSQGFSFTLSAGGGGGGSSDQRHTNDSVLLHENETFRHKNDSLRHERDALEHKT